MVAPLLVEAGLSTKYWLETRWEYLRQVIALLKPRVQFIPEFVTMGTYFFTFNGVYEPEAEGQYFDSEAAVLLETLADRFQGLTGFTLESTEQTLEALAAERGVKKASIIHPTRLAVSGASRGPGLFEMLVTLGQPVVVGRLRQAVRHIHDKN